MNINLRDRSRSFSNSNDRPSTATQPCSNRACSADLSVSAMTAADNTRSMVDTPPLSVSPMADTDDADSMVGTAPRRFWVPWDRAALDFVGMSVEVHEKLAERLGVAAAADVLLLVVAHHCGTNEHKWEQARDLGIPWKKATLDEEEEERHRNRNRGRN